jgi:hypothetical protein
MHADRDEFLAGMRLAEQRSAKGWLPEKGRRLRDI